MRHLHRKCLSELVRLMPEEHQSSQLKGHFPHINTPNPHVQSVDRGLVSTPAGQWSCSNCVTIFTHTIWGDDG